MAMKDIEIRNSMESAQNHQLQANQEQQQTFEELNNMVSQLQNDKFQAEEINHNIML